ncbi:SAM-dependent methyltransferase [Streptomyces roseoverticillatus]|uniref:methyltransferase n=1 Tax=Streptomyces roseoverticillatus TaxID=66429 RepID=UPI001F3F054A|nr:methyltransferase [Streptomyces roseoverticillatus]MCF3100385.1 SAM-dependent methyltransferase [Streptomyces roseoverticillatus]
MDVTPGTGNPPAHHPGFSAQLSEVSLGHFYASALRAVTVHRVADHLADGPLQSDELARRAGGLHGPTLRRVLRLLATRGIFQEDEQGAFALTPDAELLRTDVPASAHTGMVWITDEVFQRSAAGLEDTLRTGRTPFDTAYGMPFFDYLLTNADAQQLFDTGMASMSGPEDELIADAYEFPATGTVVDVGGGRGGLVRAVLSRNPGLTGVLFDQEQTVAEHLLDEGPSAKEIAGRWRTDGGNFFESVTPGGDIYVLKHILHDWKDEDCLRILRAIRAAIPAGGRLLAVDAILPPGNEPHFAKAVDIIMLAVVTGRERTEQEFRDLLGEAGFRVDRIISVPNSTSIIEAVPV